MSGTAVERHRALLRAMFDAAVESALPARCLPPHLPPAPKGRTIVVGAGKAAAAMAQAVEAHWPGPVAGVVVTRYGHAVPCRQIKVLEAGHPVPDQAGVAAAQAVMDAVSGLSVDDLVICLISGGGSALLPALPASVTLEEERDLARTLLRSGAAIGEMNCVRKHVSRIKGGRLAAAAFPARVEALVISDVPGDDPALVASGPTVADGSTPQDALAVIAKYGLDVAPGIRSWLESADNAAPRPEQLAHAHVRMIATAQMALEAAARVAEGAGYTPYILGDAIEGEAAAVGEMHAAIARQTCASGQPVVLLSGGETTVTVRGSGRGGRNVEYLLSLLIGLDGAPGISAIAADTDGIDGTQDNAGAIIDEGSLARAAARQADPRSHLLDNDGYTFFEAVGDLVTTGATLTNVNDFRAILIDAPSQIQEPNP